MKTLPLSLLGVALTSLLACTVAPATNVVPKKRTPSTKTQDGGTHNEKLTDPGGDPTSTPPDDGLDSGAPEPDHLDSGAAVATDEAGSAKDSASPPTTDAPTWSTIYASYFAPGTIGHCAGGGCHTNTVGGFACGNSKSSCYQGMVSAGLVSGTTSRLAGANSPLTWFGQGGGMPTGGGVDSQAAAAIAAWVAAGAMDN